MKVSLIIPVFNVALYVEDCLKSVMNQTYTGDMECLIIDDGSTDDSVAIIERLLADYEGSICFRLIHHEQNRGLSAARNTGLLKATGDYIYFLDSDDEISDDCIEKMVAVVEQDSAVELVQGKRQKSNSRPSTRNKSDVIRAETNTEVRVCYFQQRILSVYAWNKLLRRSILLDHQLLFKEGIIYEDYLWLFFVLKYLNKIVILPDVTYFYRVRPNSISTGTAKQKIAYNRNIVCKEILNNLTSGHEAVELKYYTQFFCAQYARFARTIPEFRSTFNLYWQQARQHNCNSVLMTLAVNYVAAKLKFAWMLFAIIRRLKKCLVSIR